MKKDYPHCLVPVPCYSHQCQTVWVYTVGPDWGPNGLQGNQQTTSHDSRISAFAIHISVKL